MGNRYLPLCVLLSLVYTSASYRRRGSGSKPPLLLSIYSCAWWDSVALQFPVKPLDWESHVESLGFLRIRQ